VLAMQVLHHLNFISPLFVCVGYFQDRVLRDSLGASLTGDPPICVSLCNISHHDHPFLEMWSFLFFFFFFLLRLASNSDAPNVCLPSG
jgi:hypothetical protein